MNMSFFRTPCNVALIDSFEVQRIQLRDKVQHAGCTPVLFADVSELLTVLSRGKRFDVLLVVESGNSVWSQLSAVCAVIGMPALLLARGDRATACLQDFPWSPLFDFASVDSRDDELYHRMSRLLHRAGEQRQHQQQFAQIKQTVFGGYAFHEEMHCVMHKGCEIFLQPRQFELALELFRNVGRVLERHQLWASLWGAPFAPQGGRSLDVCAANVRRKLQLCPENGFTLNSVYRRGYRLLAATSRKSPSPEFTTVARTRVDSDAASLQRPAG